MLCSVETLSGARERRRRRPLLGAVGAAAGPLRNGVGSLPVDSINFHKEMVLEYSVNFCRFVWYVFLTDINIKN